MTDFIKKFFRWLFKNLPVETKLQLRQSLSWEGAFPLLKTGPVASVPSAFSGLVNADNLLERLGEKYQPTKRIHNYLSHYWKHFRDIREQVTQVLEIGVETDKSLNMWEEFFPNAKIYGVDIDASCQAFEGGRKKVFIGDQSDPAFLSQVLRAVGGYFDIVIDDGSHYAGHQLKTFNFLFPHLSSHGIYVIEDTGGCVGDVHLNTLNAVKKLIRSIYYFPKHYPFSHWIRLSKFPKEATWADRNITGIAFYRWIVFIMRGQNPEDNRFLLREAPGKQDNAS